MWSFAERRIVARVEATGLGTDVRFIVTDLEDAGAKFLCEAVYCGRARSELVTREHSRPTTPRNGLSQADPKHRMVVRSHRHPIGSTVRV